MIYPTFSLGYVDEYLVDVLDVHDQTGARQYRIHLPRGEEDIQALRDMLDEHLAKVKRKRLDQRIAHERRRLATMVESNARLLKAENQQLELVEALVAERRELGDGSPE